MVGVTGWAILAGSEAADFRPRSDLPERKHIKLMSRAVRLGVAAVGRALGSRPAWTEVPPERRGLFVGARPVGATADLQAALEVSRDGDGVDLSAFGEQGLTRLNPLWLIKGLSNNIPGYSCAYWDLRGPVANRCEGRVGGLAAIVEAIRAVEEGRVDLAVAGGADCLIPTPPWMAGPTGEAAAFVVLERNAGRIVRGGVQVDPHAVDSPADQLLGEIGAATGPVALVRALTEGGSGAIEVSDAAVGLRAWVAVGGDGVGAQSPAR